MEVIKVRAWHEYAKEMITEENTGLSSAQILERFSNKMLYTGFKDRNAKEIYDRDIVESAAGRFLIGWDKGAFIRTAIFIYGKDGQKFPIENVLDPVHTLYNTTGMGAVKIIGNTFENPELLMP